MSHGTRHPEAARPAPVFGSGPALRRVVSGLASAVLWGTVLLAGPAFAAAPGAARQPEPAAPVRESEVVVVDQGSRAILVLPAAADAERARSAALWSWSADRDPGLVDLRPTSTWTNPSEAKRRHLAGHDYLLAGASGGLTAVVAYPSARVYWAADVGGGNPHSLELLPDGNVAVTASAGGYLRVYAASQGPRADRYAQVALPGAHGVHYDPAGGLLWALGDRELGAFTVGGTVAEPTLTRVRTTALPEAGGHDLSPVLAAPGTLWVTGADHVWQYSIAADTFTRVRLSAAGGDARVKSIGDDPHTGRVLTVTPAAGNPCAWCTSTLTLYRPDGTRTLAEARLYKARWWTARRR